MSVFTDDEKEWLKRHLKDKGSDITLTHSFGTRILARLESGEKLILAIGKYAEEFKEYKAWLTAAGKGHERD